LNFFKFQLFKDMSILSSYYADKMTFNKGYESQIKFKNVLFTNKKIYSIVINFLFYFNIIIF